jgi:hypothetical protein
MKLFTAVILFLLMFGGFLSLIYILNYALIESDNVLYSYLPAEYLVVYQLFNYVWTSMVFLVGLYILVRLMQRGE